MEKEKIVKDGGVYCKACGHFLGSVCDPFRQSIEEHTCKWVSN